MPGESPENCDERNQSDDGLYSANAEGQSTGDKLWHIVSNALVGIVGLTGGVLHAIVSSICQRIWSIWFR